MTCPNCGHSLPGLKVGDKLYGFCHGAFGRDSYGEKTVIAVGADWALVSEDIWRRDSDEETTRYLYAWSGDPNDLLEFTQPEPDFN